MLLDPGDAGEHTAALQAHVGAIPSTCSGGAAAGIRLASSAAWFVAYACGTLYAFSAPSPTALLQRELDSFTDTTVALAAHGDHLYVWSGGADGATLVAICSPALTHRRLRLYSCSRPNRPLTPTFTLARRILTSTSSPSLTRSRCSSLQRLSARRLRSLALQP